MYSKLCEVTDKERCVIFIGNKVDIRFRVSKSMHDDLKTLALKKGIPASVIIRTLIRGYLKSVHEKESRKGAQNG